jgi:hypothetical protein
MSGKARLGLCKKRCIRFSLIICVPRQGQFFSVLTKVAKLRTNAKEKAANGNGGTNCAINTNAKFPGPEDQHNGLSGARVHSCQDRAGINEMVSSAEIYIHVVHIWGKSQMIY